MHQFSLLTRRRFAPLFITQFLGALNDNVFKNALVIFIAFSVAEVTGTDSSVLVIMAAGLFILPFFLFSATAGQLADKYDKGMLIGRIKLAEIVIMALGAIGFYLQSVVVLMAVLFIMGAQSTFFGPLKYGILPQHLKDEELIGGNGMLQMGTYVAILLGTILGGVVVSIKPGGPMFVSVLAIGMAVIGWLASRWIPPAPAAEPGLRIELNLYRLMWRIIGFARETLVVFRAIILISWFWFVGATFLSLIPSYAQQVLGGNEQVVTLLLFAFSLGVGIGSLLCEKLTKGGIVIWLAPIGALGISVFSADLFLASGVQFSGVDSALLSAVEFLQFRASWRVLLDFVLIGGFGGLFIVPLYALVQQRSNPQHRARIIAANNILNALFMVVSALLTIGLFALDWTIPQVFLLVAGLNIVMVTLVLLGTHGFYRHLINSP